MFWMSLFLNSSMKYPFLVSKSLQILCFSNASYSTASPFPSIPSKMKTSSSSPWGKHLSWFKASYNWENKKKALNCYQCISLGGKKGPKCRERRSLRSTSSMTCSTKNCFKSQFAVLNISIYGVTKSVKIIARSAVERGLYFSLKLENWFD